jgi:hypothetical protein
MLVNAYDIEVLHRRVERSPDCHGWLFGLPPGITSDQWPFDPNSGYPLMHGFTLLLPEDYRIFGPDVVAVSFFGTAPDHCDGMPFEVDGMREKVEVLPTHPGLRVLPDVVFCEFRLILLTRAEFDGPLCQPPEPIAETSRPPDWMTIGAGASYGRLAGEGSEQPGSYLMRMLGEPSPPELTYTREIRLKPRANDPNAGKPPCDQWTADRGDYEIPFLSVEEMRAAGMMTDDGQFRPGASSIRPWAQGYTHNHLGGTTLSDVPFKASPYYITFEEFFGGYNFGGRSGFLDLQQLDLRWV